MSKQIAEEFKEIRRVSTPWVCCVTTDYRATVKELMKVRVGSEPEPTAYLWTCVDGARNLKNSGDMGSPDDPPSVMLKTALTTMEEGNILFLVVPDTFADPNHFWTNPFTVQAAANLRDAFKADRRTLVILSIDGKLPSLIADDVPVLKDPLPTKDELTEIAGVVSESAQVKLLKPVVDKAVSLCCGMNRFAAEEAMSRKLTRKGMDLAGLATAQRTVIEQSSERALTFDSGGESFEDVGGLDQIKKFSKLLFNGRRPPTVVVRIEEIEKSMAGAGSDSTGVSQDQLGVLLTAMEDNEWSGFIAVGHAGCSKSLISKAMGRTYKVPSISFDLGACKGQYVGQSLHPDEEIYVCRCKGGFNMHRMTMAEFHEVYASGDTNWYTWTFSDYGAGEVGKVTDSFKHVRQERYLKLTTRTGRSVTVTEGHSVFKQRRIKNLSAVAMGAGDAGAAIESGRAVGRYKDEPIFVDSKAGDLSLGDKIAIVRFLPSKTNVTKSIRNGPCQLNITEDLAFFFGLWMADGSYLADGSARVCVGDKDVEIVPWMEQAFGKENISVHTKEGILASDVYVHKHHWVNTAMRIAGMKGKSRTKRVPAWLYGCSQAVIGAFLRGYYSGDGSCTGHVVEAGTMSKNLAKDVVLLLAKLKIFARVQKRYIKEKKVNIGGRRPDYRSPEGWQYRITISKTSQVAEFQSRVGFIQGYKNDAVAETLATVPLCKYRSGRVFSSVFWDEVVKVEEVEGTEYCYDISVDGTERFVAGGVIVHNSEAKVRKSVAILRSFAGNGAFFIATSNDINIIKPALRRRFKCGVFMFDLPSPEERQQIWKINIRKFELDPAQPLPDDKDFTGSDIRNICEIAYSLCCPLTEAATFVVPVAKSDPSEIERLRNAAHGKFLSASSPGAYQRPSSRDGRAISV